MKRPPKVKTKYKSHFEVVGIDQFSDPNIMGECRFNPHQIVIKESLTHLQSRKTFLHEILHALSFEYDASLTEQQVLKLEDGLFYFFKHNKKALKYIINDGNKKNRKK